MQFQTKLLNKYQITKSSMAFEIEKPFTFKFSPGQTIDIILDEITNDPQGNKRIFSIASAPSEKNILIATRITDSLFKKSLNNLSKNSIIKISGPNGVFKLQGDITKPVVLIAGGIGITPFRSIILDEKEHDFPHKLFLFYSNKHLESTPFFYTFSNINHAHFNFIPTMTDVTEPDDWSGERQRINQKMIQKYVYNVLEAIYYLAGPQKMVLSLRKMLISIGVKIENIKTSIFIGY